MSRICARSTAALAAGSSCCDSDSGDINFSQITKMRLKKFFKKFTNHEWNEICGSGFEGLVQFMYSPVDSASLGVGRMLFGLMMLMDIPDERTGADMDFRWGDPRDCRFPLFPFIKALPLPRMGMLYGVMWLGALGVTLGYKFKVACAMMLMPYWYLFFLDKSSWNNHSYLYGLVTGILLFTQANRYCSIDAWMNPNWPRTVPYWNYFLVKFQFFVLYFIAGLKKMCSEWLSGYSMTNLSYHWVFAPIRTVIGAHLTDLLVIHWFGAFFDLTIAFFLIYRYTRPIASLFAASFHLMNSQLFSIGMFPWVCLVELPLFYETNWPRVVFSRRTKKKVKAAVHDCGNVDNLSHGGELRVDKLSTNKWAQKAGDYIDGDEHDDVVKTTGSKAKSKRRKRFFSQNEKSKSLTAFDNSLDISYGFKDENGKLRIRKNRILAQDQEITAARGEGNENEIEMPRTENVEGKTTTVRDDFSVHYHHHQRNDNDVRRDGEDHRSNDGHTNTDDVTGKWKIKNNLSSSLFKAPPPSPLEDDNDDDDDNNEATTENSATAVKKILNPQVSTSTMYAAAAAAAASMVGGNHGEGDDSCYPACISSPLEESSSQLKPTRRNKIAMTFMIIYCGLQLFLPYSHFITKGYNNWTNGLYGYSWDMMVHAWDTVLIAVKVVDNPTGEIHFLEPFAFSENDRWTKHADMAVQYAHCIEQNIIHNAERYKGSFEISSNISIYFDVWCSLNGRFQQRFFNPNMDMLKVEWSPFTQVSFTVPLLKEFTYMRPRLNALTEEVLSWSNHTDVMFIADFPGFTMDNYISPDLDNVTLTILEGTVVYEEENSQRILTLVTGDRCTVTPNKFHRITTVSSTPSCYMYSFVNKTLQEMSSDMEMGATNSIEHQKDNNVERKSAQGNNSNSASSYMLLFDEMIRQRWENYKKFLSHLANSILYEVYGVPMPRRLKEIL